MSKMPKDLNEYEKKAKIKAIGNYVIVLPESVEKVTEGGIILANESLDKQKAMQNRGTLISIGVDAFEYMEESKDAHKPGDKVIFPIYGGVTIYGADDTMYRCINDRDLLSAVYF